MEAHYVLEKRLQLKQGKRQPDVRERMLRDGPQSLADRELVAAVLGSGCAGKSVRILSHQVCDAIDFGNQEMHFEKLREMPGLGSAKICSIAAAIELGRRFYSAKDKRIAMPKDVFPLITHFADRKQEHFLCVSLNGAHEVIAIRQISSGLVNKTVVHPREIFADPITDRACAIVVAHNHPSGSIEPSKEDIDITKRLREAGETLGIPVLDHLIFCHSSYYSFVEHGLITPYSGE